MKALHSKLELAVDNSKGSYRPVLTQAHLDVETSRLMATNGHILAVVPVDVEPGDVSGPVSIDAIKAARKTDKRCEQYEIKCNGSLELSDGQSFPREGEFPQYPDVDSVSRQVDKPADFTINLNAELLYKLAQAIGADKKGDYRVRLSFRDIHSDKQKTAIEVTNPANEAHGLLMPMRDNY